MQDLLRMLNIVPACPCCGFQNPPEQDYMDNFTPCECGKVVCFKCVDSSRGYNLCPTCAQTARNQEMGGVLFVSPGIALERQT
jgi:hypothetical protein